MHCVNAVIMLHFATNYAPVLFESCERFSLRLVILFNYELVMVRISLLVLFSDHILEYAKRLSRGCCLVERFCLERTQGG